MKNIVKIIVASLLSVLLIAGMGMMAYSNRWFDSKTPLNQKAATSQLKVSCVGQASLTNWVKAEEPLYHELSSDTVLYKVEFTLTCNNNGQYPVDTYIKLVPKKALPQKHLLKYYAPGNDSSETEIPSLKNVTQGLAWYYPYKLGADDKVDLVCIFETDYQNARKLIYSDGTFRPNELFGVETIQTGYNMSLVEWNVEINDGSVYPSDSKYFVKKDTFTFIEPPIDEDEGFEEIGENSNENYNDEEPSSIDNEHSSHVSESVDPGDNSHDVSETSAE